MDTIEKIGNSIIQHGRHNDRIYLMKLDPTDMPLLMDKLESLAEQEHYSKIFTKVPESFKKVLSDRNYLCEALIPRYYDGKEDAVVMSKFLDAKRSINRLNELHDNVIKKALSKEKNPHSILPSGYSIRKCVRHDIKQMAGIYQKTFETYPFPIHDPDYLLKTMEENVVYFGVFKKDKIVALSSAEIDYESSNVEMTDFATLPEFRGKGLSSHLLMNMDKEMKATCIRTAYTIARANSYGMNIVFAKCGYEYCGRLVNNTNISGNIESMNIWYRCL
ncbi:putative beta-lysine N-acetyltransferase [Methanohalophilus sp.]|uniref:putative beta-lysine N-acetyltransferase n=1 Tax=Methanohalophilus sp. TaxID=1966352 RepID=UPI002612D018|nr:putative beta-lysine N-acetyltransferase [Methanohalophilus sp.]MDK2892054.1 beta-lysine N6-acetyltransferase [Methanohalophilus sp.]